MMGSTLKTSNSNSACTTRKFKIRTAAEPERVFDQMMDERSENMREIDTLRNVDMTQRKADDSITKKFIQSITE